MFISEHINQTQDYAASIYHYLLITHSITPHGAQNITCSCGSSIAYTPWANARQTKLASFVMVSAFQKLLAVLSVIVLALF
jgi:hypothetical protein